jgi:hypothetical protein
MKRTEPKPSSNDVLIYVVTDPHWHVKQMTTSELASIVTTREFEKIRAMVRGETISFARGFGNRALQITATAI